MAIDRTRTRELLAQIDALFNAEVAGLPLSSAALTWVKEKVFGEALGELRRMIEEARPPVFYLLGRSQHGKSSLINHLAGKKVAEVGGEGVPVTRGAERHRVRYPERHAEWVMIDSRGIFEVVPTAKENAADVARQQILDWKPDVVLHVVSITEVANLANDVRVLADIQQKVAERAGTRTPVVVVLTKADNVNPVSAWPPEQHPAKRKAIGKHVASMATHGIGQAARHCEPIVLHEPEYGCHIAGDSPFLAVVPVNVPTDSDGIPILAGQWNLNTLLDVIGGQLPQAARLLFFQAAQRRAMLRQMSSALIQKFAAIAGGVALVPTFGLSDIFVLTPLQMVMVAAVGGLSCRPVAKATALEYLSAAGVDLASGVALRALAGFLATLIPGGTIAKSGIAASATYGIGKAAETYFFAGQLTPPQTFQQQYRPGSVGGEQPARG